MSLIVSNARNKVLMLCLVMLCVFSLGFSQDFITAFGQKSPASLDVDTPYTFSLTSPAVAAATATWTVTGGVGPLGVSDFLITGAPNSVVTIWFSPNLIDPTNLNKNINDTYVVKASYGGVDTSITVVLLKKGGLLAQNIQVKFKKLDVLTGLYTDISSLDLIKGESSAEGELLQIEVSLIPKTPMLPISLATIRKIGLRVVNTDGSDLFPSINIPPLLQITAGVTNMGNFANSTIPAIDLSTNQTGKKNFVFYPYAELPYVMRMDTIDYNNNAIEPRDNFENLGRELLDPRINYDMLRSKLWLPANITSLTVMVNGIGTSAAIGDMLTDPGALIDVDTNPIDTVYNFRPNPTPSAVSLVGAGSGVFANRFVTTLSGERATIEFPIKALEHGGVGGVRLYVDLFSDVNGTAAAMNIPLVVQVSAKIPDLKLSALLDGETVNNANTITGVAGKDINLRIFVDRTLNTSSKFIPALEGVSGAQEYILVDTGVPMTTLWAFRNFDETVFDAMEFDPTLYLPSHPQTETSVYTLFRGVPGRPSWKHHGYHINLQSLRGSVSNILFNDIPFLIAHDDDAFDPANVSNGAVIHNNSRYTLTSSTKIGLLNNSANQRFMYSQARLYTRDYNLRENLPIGQLRFTTNLFSNSRDNINQRAITLVPRTVGNFPIKIQIKTTEGSQTIDELIVVLDIIKEEINSVTMDPAEVGDFQAKPVRAGDMIVYNDKSFTSTYSDFGILAFDMRMEGIGAATDILYDTISGYNGAKSYNEVDLDDLGWFSFFVKNDYHFYYVAPNDGGGLVKAINGGTDLDGDNVVGENFYETTGRPEPFHLLGNGIDDDGDGVVDDNVAMATGRAASNAIRVNWAERSAYYYGGTLRNYYAFAQLQIDVNLYLSAVSTLINQPTVTVANLTAMQAAYPTISSAGITAAYNAAKTDPFLTNTRQMSPRRIKLINDIMAAISAYQYNTIGYGTMVNEIVLTNPLDPSRPRDDFAPIPIETGIPNLEENKYFGEIIHLNRYTTREMFGQNVYRRPIKLAYAVRTCIPLKEVYFKFTHQIPWVNRNGGSGFVPLSFARKGTALTTGFSFSPAASVSDHKYVGPLADTNIFPFFTNAQATQLGLSATYQNFSTAFRFTGGVVDRFVNRMTNNYRPFLNMFEPGLNPPPQIPPLEYSNLAGLNGWVYEYSGATLNVINDGVGAEAKNWVVEQRVGPIVDLPDAVYTPPVQRGASLAKANQIIIPEEDSRWRPDDKTLQGFESWYRTSPTKEVLSMESAYIPLFGIDQAYDPEHTGGPNAGAFGSYIVFHTSPTPAYHEQAGNNLAMRLYLPTAMLDNGNPVRAPLMIYEDTDDSGTFNLAVDRLVSNPGGQHHYYVPFLRSYYTLIMNQGNTFFDDKYDEMYDFFIVAVLDSGYPDLGTGAPPFNTGSQPDSSAVRFGLKIELFNPTELYPNLSDAVPTVQSPKATPDYMNFMDRDGKDERSVQDNYFLVNVRADDNDVDMKIDIYADIDHPLESGGFVVHQGGSKVYGMTGRDQIGGPSGSSVAKDLKTPQDLLSTNFTDAPQRYGTATFPFVPFVRKSLSDMILYGDQVNPPLFPLTAQGTTTLPNGIVSSYIHLPILPIAERAPGYDRKIERQKTWRNDIYAQVRPYERDKNGNGICDADEDFNGDGMFTQDVVLLRFTPEKYPAGHPKAGQSYYNPTNDFLNMADIRWSIIRNESGSYLSSNTGYLKPGDATGTSYVTYYPGSLNGLDWVKGENIKTGKSLIAAILVRNNPATDGIDNDNDAADEIDRFGRPVFNKYVTTIGSLMGLSTTDPRYNIRCINPSAVFSSDPATFYASFPSIDFADDDYLDPAGSLDPGYQTQSFTNIGTGSTNKGNTGFIVGGSYNGFVDIDVVITSTYPGTRTVGVNNDIPFTVTYTEKDTLITTTANLTLGGTGTVLIVYSGDAYGSNVRVTFDANTSLAQGDTFHFTMLGVKDFDGDLWPRGRELADVPGAMFSEMLTGYDTGLEIDISWNNPRPFYAIKVRADKTAGEWDGEYGKDYVFSTPLRTREVVGSGVWTSTVEMQLNDMRYLGAAGILSAPPIALSNGFDSSTNYLYYVVNNIVNNTNSRSYAAGNLFVVTENQYAITQFGWMVPIDIVANPGTDLIRITQNPNGVMRGEWRDDTGDVDNYYFPEYCIFPHMTVDAQMRSIYDFDIATMPGDHSRYAAAVFESNHTVADYSQAGTGLVRIDPNSMPTPVLQLDATDTDDPVTLTFTDGERLQKIRVNFLDVRNFKPSTVTDDPNSKPKDSMLAPLSNDMLGGISVWKDNKDPGAMSVAIANGSNLITSGRSALIGSRGQFDALVDIVVDLDGWDSPRAYTNYRNQFSNPPNESPLSSFKPEDKLFFVDRDGSKSFTLGDDIYYQEQPGVASSIKIIYTQGGFGKGVSYSLGDPVHADDLRYYDENGNGKYDNGEDIVYEFANKNGVWELPIDQYVPLDKDALKWRWDKENNLWYIVLDLENDEEIPPSDIFTDLATFVSPAWPPVDPTTLGFPGGVEPNFYAGADYHICIRASTYMDYLTAFRVEISDYLKHTQALTDFRDIGGVWLATQPQAVTYPSMPGSSIVSPIIVANMPVLISDEGVDRPTRSRIGRNSKPFAALGINMVDNNVNGMKLNGDLLKTMIGLNMEYIPGANFGVELANISNNRKTVLEDLVVEFFNDKGGVSNTTATGTIVPGDFNPAADLLSLDRTTRGDNIFRSLDGSGIFKAGDTKILRQGSKLINGRIVQNDLTIGKQGKQDTDIVYIDINGNGLYDDNLDILVYDVDGLTSDGLATGNRTFKFGDAILKRGFSNWDPSLGAANDVTKLQPNDVSALIGKPLKYDASIWFEDNDNSGAFSNEISASGVALYRDRSDGSPYDNGKFDYSISSKNEVIILDEVIYLEQIEFTGQPGQPQHQVRMRPAVFDISPTMLPKVSVNGLVDLSSQNFNHYTKDFGRTAKASHGGTGEDYRESSNDDLFNPFIDLNGDGIDDSNKLYSYNKDTSLPDHHPLRVNLFQDKLSPAYGDENGMGPYGEWGYLRAPFDDGYSSLAFDANKSIIRNTGNKHLGPDFFVVIRTSSVITNGDDFRVGISSWGRDTSHVMRSAPQNELGSRGIGFDDRVEDSISVGPGGGINTANPFVYPTVDTTNSRTYTKFLSSVVHVDGQAPDDVKVVKAVTEDITHPGTILKDKIQLSWEWVKEPDTDRKGVLLIRRKGLAPNLKLLEDGQYYIGPEITKEKGEANRIYLPGYLGFATRTKLTADVSAGSLLSSALTSASVSISHADFANLPVPPSGGKCYLLIGATAGGDKAEVVSYTTVGSTLTITRGELGTTAIAHSVNAPVSFLPPRPVELAEYISDIAPTATEPLALKVAKTESLKGYPAVGVIRIGTEVLKYDGVTFGVNNDTLNIVARGVDSTTVAVHSAGNKINWSYHPTYVSDVISVTNTSGFPVSGRIRIDNEEMWYNSKTATSFRGIARGIKTDDSYKTDTAVMSHNIGAEVIDSLYKVIMNDQDLDGPNDFNNDGNDDKIVTSWVDDLYYGDDPTAYFYYIFTYDDVLNYSNGKFASVNNMKIKRTTQTGATAVFNEIDLGNVIHVNGGDTVYLMVDGGFPRFTWTASASGLSTDSPPAGYDAKGETGRYITYKVPDITDVEHTNIIITTTDSSENHQSLSAILYVDYVTPVVDLNAFRVTSDKGTPPLNTNKDATINVLPGDIVTFKAYVPSTKTIAMITWTPGAASTFFGSGVVNTPDTLVYTAVSQVNPALQAGTDIITVSDGTTTITITIIISPKKADEPCDTGKPLDVIPGHTGSVTVSPGSAVVFTASGGTCSFEWALVANNSITASIVKVNNIKATYTAGMTNRQVDIIQLSDGVNVKKIKVHVTASSTNGRSGGGCFIRTQSHQD